MFSRAPLPTSSLSLARVPRDRLVACTYSSVDLHSTITPLKPLANGIAKKKPQNAFFIYQAQVRDQVKLQHPNARVTEIAKIIGKMWKALSEGEKQRYLMQAEQDKRRYVDELSPGPFPSTSSSNFATRSPPPPSPLPPPPSPSTRPSSLLETVTATVTVTLELPPALPSDKATPPGPPTPNSVSDENSSNSPNSPQLSSSVAASPSQPWTLTGRMVPEDSETLLPTRSLVKGFAFSAAERESGLPRKKFDKRLSEVFALIPGLEERLIRLKPSLVAELVKDPRQLAYRLIAIKDLFPRTDIAKLVASRPALLLSEFDGLEARRAHLGAIFGEAAEPMVSKEPTLLVADIERALEDIQRLYGKETHEEAVDLLKSSPSLVLAVQSGTNSLGPGAEF